MTTTQPRRHGKAADIDPARYTHLGDFYQGDSEEWYDVYAGEHRALDQELTRIGTTWDDALPTRATCAHCGARFNHGAMYAFDDHEVVIVGQVCSANTFGHRDKHSLAQARLAKAYAAAKERAELEAKRNGWLAEDPTRATLIEFLRGRTYDEFFTSLVTGYDRWGTLSEKQEAAARRSMTRTLEREAERATEVRNPVIEGRITIEGTVVSVKTQENDFGTRLVMTVKDDRGFLVWGTVPSALEGRWNYEDEQEIPDSHVCAHGTPIVDCPRCQHVTTHRRVNEVVWVPGAERGARVKFTATVTKSDRDECFGFYKRPAKAELLQAAPEEA